MRTTTPELSWESVSHNPAIKKQVFLSNGEVPHITQFARSILGPGQVSPGHSHDDMWEVFQVTAGTLTVDLDGDIHTLPAGSTITVQPGEVHELSNQGQEDLHLTYFGILQ